MSLLKRLFGGSRADQAQVRPLWHRVVELARDPALYARGGIEDSLAGRFDAMTLVLALVMLRMEGDDTLRGPSARLTELFVADLDGQLRQSGMGDPGVGKRVGKLMGALGGRIDAFRAALAETDDNVLKAAIERNVTVTERADPGMIARHLRDLSARLAALGNADLLAGRIPQ